MWGNFFLHSVSSDSSHSNDETHCANKLLQHLTLHKTTNCSFLYTGLYAD